ncbi:beta-sandwich lipoprotein [Lactococcus lactis]|uniref:beta-sandwich lipoprotein n=1 Tax=Lactococcus lactis TaxID=1358 RepID=UPI0039828A03
MKKIKNIAISTVLGASALIGLSACSQADKVSQNVSNDADNFKVERRVVIINTRTDKIEFVAKGLISVNTGDSKKLVILAKVGKSQYKKDIINLTNNNMYTVEDLSGANVNSYKYEVTWLPESVVPVKIVGKK